VGAVAAALVIAELLRLVMGDRRYELITCHLREITGRTVLKGQPWGAFTGQLGELLGESQRGCDGVAVLGGCSERVSSNAGTAFS
jgi:hypothetical protein